VKEVNGRSYISLTDIAKFKNKKEPWRLIKYWLRNKSTINYINEWEKINNPDYGGVKFYPTKNHQLDKSIGILIGKRNHGEGTFAEIDIALEFTRSISPIFALYVNTEFVRLKQAEQNVMPWNPVEDIKKIPLAVETVTVKYKKTK
jgi:hypothetical protein